MVIPEHRPEDELAEWHERDPIPRFEEHLLREGVITDDELADLVTEVEAQLRAAADFARESDLPNADSVAHHLWA